ncbi:MAG: helix-turn-helix domain-containing protein [Dehalococcoidia bacterium]|nr:helix-turn-helix domain-containing protein [Dehalococcoidia bacterium]MDW8009546.1 helix-turn-helix domain-containing protein [Chloroflexota bacterium]
MATKTASEATETRPTRWLTLGEACKLLGVNESTLRRWADAGHVRSFRTPGGHRRFSEEDLRALIEGHTAERRASYRDLGQLALARIRRRLQRGRAQAAEWYTNLPEAARERLRPLGRRLVALVSDYLGRGSQRGRLLEEAREVALEYGRELKGEGVPLRAALEAFVFFRRGLTDSAVELCQRNNLSAEEAVEVWDLLSTLADQVLLALADAYSQDGQQG